MSEEKKELSNHEGLLLKIETVQASSIRSLIEALKEIIIEANIVFSPKGIQLNAADASVTVLADLTLHAKEFEYFYCEKTMVVGINMSHLFTLLKTLGTGDTLTLYIEKEKGGNGPSEKLGITIQNEKANKVTDYKLSLMDINEGETATPSEKYDFVVTMPSNEFQSICRDAQCISEIIEIKCSRKQLTFSCEGDFASQETTYGETNSGISFKKLNNKNISDKIVQGYYPLKYLNMFAKCANLGHSIELYIENSYPLLIKFSVGSLGHLKMFLAPRVDEGSLEEEMENEPIMTIESET